jgi:hypothetical protein
LLCTIDDKKSKAFSSCIGHRRCKFGILILVRWVRRVNVSKYLWQGSSVLFSGRERVDSYERRIRLLVWVRVCAAGSRTLVLSCRCTDRLPTVPHRNIFFGPLGVSLDSSICAQKSIFSCAAQRAKKRATKPVHSHFFHFWERPNVHFSFLTTAKTL